MSESAASLSVKDWVPRIAWVLGAILYIGFIVRWHDRLQQPALAMQQQLGMPLWHWGLIGLMLVAVAAGLWIVRNRDAMAAGMRGQRVAVPVITALGVTGIAFLMVNAVEAIHYVQYAALVLLLFKAAGRALPAFFLAILIGVLDEWHQLYILHPSWQPYLDYNDLVLNTIGAMAGLTLLRTISRPAESRREWWAWAALPLIVLLLFQVDFLALYADGGQWVLNRWNYPNPTTFGGRWMDTGWGNHWFMLSWVEGFVLTWGLPWILYAWPRRTRETS